MTDIRWRDAYPRRRRLHRLQALAAVGAVGLVLLGTACGGSSPGASGESRYAQELAYAQCMRTHGEPTWPDPSSNGGFLFPASNPLNTSTAAYRRATTACKSLQPDGSGLTATQIQAGLARLLKYSDCMRAHSVLNFPDPKTTDVGGRAGIALILQPSGPNAIDLQSPQYQAASKACQPLMTKGIQQ
jgi:hypothetical protein